MKNKILLYTLAAVLCGTMAFMFYDSDNLVYKSKASGLWNDTATWMKYDSTSGKWIDAHNVPDGNNDVYLESGFTVTLDGDAFCRNINFNTDADVVRFNGNNHELTVNGTLGLYEGAAPGGSGYVYTSGILNWIQTGQGGAICFSGTDDRTIIPVGKYNANNTNSGWNCKIIFASGKVAFIDDRVRIENVDVVSGVLKHREELRLGTNYPDNIQDTTINGKLVVRSGAGLIAGSKITKNANYKADSVYFESGSSLSLSRNLSIKARTIVLPSTINYNGFTISY